MPREAVYDAQNEQVVIRAALAEEKSRKILVHQIAADEFLVPAHQAIWRALRAVVDGGLELGPETLRKMLAREGVPQDDDYLAELEGAAAVPVNLAWHVETLRWDSTRASVLSGPLPELVRDLEDPKATIDAVTSSARSVLRALEGGGGRKHVHRPDALAREYKADLKNRSEIDNFYPTGFEAVDAKLTEGLMPGRLVEIVGVNGSGKTTFACALALSLARLGRRPLYCAWEMGAKSTIDMMISSLTGIELKPLVQGTISQDDYVRAERATDWILRRIRFMRNPFFDRTGKKRTNDGNLDIIEGYLAEAACPVVIFDLWTKAIVDHRPDAAMDALNREQQMAAEYGFCAVNVLQINTKDLGDRPDKRPTKAGIKGTGAYSENPDLILGIHREAQFKNVEDKSIEVICLKQRKGEDNWAVRFDWDGARCGIKGGVQVPYDPGLESSDEFGGELTSVSKIRTRSKMGRRDP